MSTARQAIFTKDLANKNLTVTREFAAPVARVWKAWTTAEILDQWWAPKPWKANTKTMDFREGGLWHYNMEGPEGEIHWCRFDYETINAGTQYTGIDAFCDENGNLSGTLPRMHWTNSFASTGGETSKVTVKITFEKEEDIQTIIEMGFQEGFSMGLNNLDEVLANS